MNLFLFNVVITSVLSTSVTLTPDNHVSLKGPINSYTASKFISDINKVSTNHIYMYIDSPGGSVPDGHKIIQYMQYKIDNNSTILCIAWQASSMAFHIFQHCSHRYILKDSRLMQHPISLHNLSGQIENINNYIKMIYNIYNDLLITGSKRLLISPDQYLSNINNDWQLYGKAIIENNAADTILSSVGCSKDMAANDESTTVLGTLYISSACPINGM
jgi:ATP-dependent protease ClpP protease subunit